MKIKCCHECPNRHVGCHSTCEIYIKERAALDEHNRQRNAANEISNAVFKTQYNGLKKSKKPKERGRYGG